MFAAPALHKYINSQQNRLLTSSEIKLYTSIFNPFHNHKNIKYLNNRCYHRALYIINILKKKESTTPKEASTAKEVSVVKKALINLEQKNKEATQALLEQKTVDTSLKAEKDAIETFEIAAKELLSKKEIEIQELEKTLHETNILLSEECKHLDALLQEKDILYKESKHLDALLQEKEIPYKEYIALDALLKEYKALDALLKEKKASINDLNVRIDVNMEAIYASKNDFNILNEATLGAMNSIQTEIIYRHERYYYSLGLRDSSYNY